MRLQTGSLYAKITAERSAGRFGVDVLQLSDISPAIDFQKKGGWEQYLSPEYADYKAEYQSTPPGYYGVPASASPASRTTGSKVKPEQAPKTWKDIINPAYKDGISAKLATSGMQHAQWYILRKMYGNDFWQEFAKQRPKGFDARAQLFDRLAKGEDRICALAEYAGYTLFGRRAPRSSSSRRRTDSGDGIYIGVVTRPRIRKRPSSSWTGPCPAAARRSTRTRRSCSTDRCGPTRARCRPASGSSDFKLLFPTDWNDYVESHPCS